MKIVIEGGWVALGVLRAGKWTDRSERHHCDIEIHTELPRQLQALRYTVAVPHRFTLSTKRRSAELLGYFDKDGELYFTQQVLAGPRTNANYEPPDGLPYTARHAALDPEHTT